MQTGKKRELTCDVAVIGGGPGGIAAALTACFEGADVLIVERNFQLGGILNQCIHNGFGLDCYGQDLTGPEFAATQREELENTKIKVLKNTFVIEIKSDRTLTAVNQEGLITIRAGAIVLAMGCREKTRDAILIPGTRTAGVFTAGQAQYFVNIANYVPGTRFVIMGSGDIGLIMARRLTMEGMKVLGVYEIMPEPGGLKRNIKNCLDDFDIPLHLSATVSRIIGKDRIEAVEVSQVDEKLQVIPGTQEIISCDGLILAVGLIPENELTRNAGAVLNEKTGGPVVNQQFETSIAGIFACGNVLHVYDTVDSVVAEAKMAGSYAGIYAKRKEN